MKNRKRKKKIDGHLARALEALVGVTVWEEANCLDKIQVIKFLAKIRKKKKLLKLFFREC